MEVLFVSYKYPPSIGGMQKQSYELISGFEAQGGMHKLVHNYQGYVFIFFLSLFFRIPYMLIKHPGIDVIHFNDGVCGLCCIWVRLITRRKLSVTYHGLDLVFPNRLYQFLIRKWMIHFDVLIAVSEYTKSLCVEKGFDKSKVFTVLNGVSTNDLCQPELVSQKYKTIIHRARQSGKSIITAIGRPVSRKGFVWFVKEVLPKLNSHIFILIGPYPKYGKFLQALLKILPSSLSNQVVMGWGLSTEHNDLVQLEENNMTSFRWLKDVDNNTKNYLLKNSDLLVMPNVKISGDMEGFGLVALEANSCGVPVVASRIEGITSAVTEGINGLLLSDENNLEWIEKLNSLSFSNYNETYTKKALREFVANHYSWHKMVSRYRAIFEYSINNQLVVNPLINHSIK